MFGVILEAEDLTNLVLLLWIDDMLNANWVSDRPIVRPSG